MKKFALPLVFAFSLIAALFTACSDPEPLVAPENKWCSMTSEVAGKTLKFSLYYTEVEKKVDCKSGELVLAPGLTVVTSTDVDTTFVDTVVWTYKTFELGKNIDSDDEDDSDDTEEDSGSSKSFKVNGTTWDAIYLKYKNDFATPTSSTPRELVKGTSVEKLQDLASDSTSKLTWKKIIRSILLKGLDD